MLPEDNAQSWVPNATECFGKFVRFRPEAEVQAECVDCLIFGQSSHTSGVFNMSAMRHIAVVLKII